MTYISINPSSMPSTDGTDSEVFIEWQEVTLSSNTGTCNFSAPFTSTPNVQLTIDDDSGTSKAVSIDEDGTHSKDSVDIVGEHADGKVQVRAVGT